MKLALAAGLALLAGLAPPPAQDVDWHDAQKIGVEGRGWPDADMKRYFARLPARAQGKVPPAVWNLGQHSAGLVVRFETDATSIRVRYTLLSENLAMSHMPATGVSGVDLYGRDEKGAWRWIGVARPTRKDVEAVLASGLPPEKREYAIYLPLYNGVERLEIGVPRGTAFRGLPPRTGTPVVFYGTSITHGACASRPGMCHPAILGRRLDLPVINLGFSGNGRMESSVGKFLAEIDAAVFVIDCLPNMNPAQVKERAAPLVRQLRQAHPGAAIVLVEDRPFTNSWILAGKREFHRQNHAALRAAWEELKGESVPGLSYLEGDLLLGEDADGATDGSHPSDLGFFRQANLFEQVLRQALKPAGP